MPRQSLQELADMAVGGRLREIIEVHRENGLSDRKIAALLAEHHNILCSHVMVWEWRREWGIE